MKRPMFLKLFIDHLPFFGVGPVNRRAQSKRRKQDRQIQKEKREKLKRYLQVSESIRRF
ncbi:hypothetical protein [Rickettsiella massiliensis]|uniref:hypothetical protein n=1 Tax=Rickettsiella massiliensis TaxID=676517 RepID=UPI0003192387|nr:hypothetical protein [Rickettsiella massiliensis]